VPDSLHWQCLEGVARTIRDLKLAGVPGADPLDPDKVTLSLYPQDDNKMYPGVQVCLGPGPETLEGLMNTGTDVGYPCWVAMAVPADRTNLDVDHPLNMWREQGLRQFHRTPNTRVTSLPHLEGLVDPVVPSLTYKAFKCMAEPGPTVDLPFFQNASIFRCTFTVRVWLRKQH